MKHAVVKRSSIFITILEPYGARTVKCLPVDLIRAIKDSLLGLPFAIYDFGQLKRTI
jgi:hypothetical protein